MDKVVGDVHEAVRNVQDGASIAIGGFGPAGYPEGLLAALVEGTQRNLHFIANGTCGDSVPKLLEAERIRKFSGGFVFSGPWHDAVLTGKVEIEVVPQGTIAERLRAGAAGIAAFYTATSTGTALEHGGFPSRFDTDGKPVEFSEPKESREFDGRRYVLEPAIKPDIGFVKAAKADRAGNLVFRLTSQNFNAVIAMASRCTIVEAEEIVEIGEIDPDDIDVPGRFVDVVVHMPFVEVEEAPSAAPKASTPRPVAMGFSRDEIAQRIGRDIGQDWCVNLGVGMPILSAKYIDPSKQVQLHMENGILGAGGPPSVPDRDLIDPGGGPASLVPGAAIFDSALSFLIVRGGHLDLTVLGGLQVSAKGDLANWYLPGGQTGVGGAMDLVQGAQRVWVAMEHTDRNGGPKIVEECTFELTGPGVVDRIYSNLGIFSFESGSLALIERAPDVSDEYLRSVTGAPFTISC